MIDYIKIILAEPEWAARAARLELKNIRMDVHDFGVRFGFDYKTVVNGAMTIPANQLHSCCGVHVVHEITLSPSYIEYPKVPMYRLGLGGFFFDLYVETVQRRARGVEPFTSPFSAGLLLASTNHYQIAGAALLKSRRWKRLQVFRNPNTGNVVTTWQKKLTTKAYDR